MRVKAPRPGTIASSAAHTAILAYAIIGFSSKPYEVTPTEALPIDIITPQQYDALTKGVKTSKLVAPPKLQATKMAEAPSEPKPEELPEAKADIAPPPPPPEPRPEPKLAEQPKPEPPPPAPPPPMPVKPPPPAPQPPKLAEVPTPAPRPPEPKPAPPKPEQAEAEIPRPLPKQEPPKPQPPQKVAELPKPVPPVPTPAPKPVPQQPKPDPLKDLVEKTKDVKPNPRPVQTAQAAPASAPQTTPAPPQRKFDLSKISALADKREPTRTASLGRQLAQASTAGVATGTAPKLSLSEQRMIDGIVTEQVRPRWSPPIGALSAQDLQVRVRFSLGPDGSLVGMPTIVNRGANPLFQAAADAAVRAVRMAAPLKGLPQQSYDYWREVEITFDPRDMAGG